MANAKFVGQSRGHLLDPTKLNEYRSGCERLMGRTWGLRPGLPLAQMLFVTQHAPAAGKVAVAFQFAPARCKRGQGLHSFVPQAPRAMPGEQATHRRQFSHDVALMLDPAGLGRFLGGGAAQDRDAGSSCWAGSVEGGAVAPPEP